MSNREYMYTNFSFVDMYMYIWNDIQEQFKSNASHSTFKSNTKN